MTCLIVIVPMEGRPRFIADAMTEKDAGRLYDWLRYSPALLVLASEAIELHLALVGEEPDREEPDPEEAA